MFGPTKLISLNGVLKPYQYVANQAAIEALPFDGYTFTFQATWQPFFSTGLNDAGLAQDKAALASIGPAKLSNSFALVWATPPTDAFDWYDDAAWVAGEPALREIVRLAKTNGMKGIFFDPEPYNGRFIWSYANQPTPAGLTQRPSFADYKAKLFSRGARFMQVVQEEAPGLTVMTTRLLTDAAADLKASTTTAEFDTYRQDDQYFGLYDSFAAGMVHGISGSTILIEGNERSYDYATEADFTSANTEIRTGLKGLLAPADQAKFDLSVQVGHSSFPFGVRQSADARWIGYFLPDESTRNAVLTDNVRNSLLHSDTYAWSYADTESTLWDLATTQPAVVAALQAGKSAAVTNGPPVANQPVAAAARDQFANAQNMLGIIRTSAGVPVAGVAVAASPYGLTCTATDASGMYFCRGQKGWTGTITPSKTSLQFSPPALTIQPLNSFRNGFNFTASPGTATDGNLPPGKPPATEPTPAVTLPLRLLDSRNVSRGNQWEFVCQTLLLALPASP
jgi:hypothetical protein